MIVYEETKKDFLEDVYQDRVVRKILEKFNTGSSERESWIDAANHMAKILVDDRFPDDITVAMEFKLYNTSMRIDFIVTGLNEDKKNAMIIIEFKRWEKVKVVADRDDMVELGPRNIKQHPSYQALGYVKVIKNFYVAAEDGKMEIMPCSCLHRYEKKDINDDITNEHYKELLEESPIFLNGENDKLKEFIAKYIKYGDNKETLYKLENGEIKPSKQLQDKIASMIEGNDEFSMVGMQKDVLENAKNFAYLSSVRKDGKKRVYIVEGGPGTGKSVIAINLLGKLMKKYGMNCQYITKNQNPRDVYSTQLKGTYKKTEIDNLFSGSGAYMNCKKNFFDALIVDEAHRVTEKTGFMKMGENQIKEIINSSRFSVFFIDPKQRVHINDYGTIERVEKIAKELGAEVSYDKLDVQFRCSGAENFITWVEKSLQYEDVKDEDIDINFLKNYNVKIFDDPNEMRNKIIECNKVQNKSRIIAGYCWDWNSKGDPEGEKYDIVITTKDDDRIKNDFKMKWNFNNTIWAIGEKSVDQAGCIHTSQGLEFDYVGIIIGNDLRYEDGKIVTDYTKRAKIDRNNGSMKGMKSLYKKDPKEASKLEDELIKNTYRTLLTRGQKGCYIYCADRSLAEYLKRGLESFEETIYPIDEDDNNDLMVAEDSEEYIYE